MKKFLRNLSFAVALFVSLAAFGQQKFLVNALTTNVASNLVAQAITIDNFTTINTGATLGTLYFYDTASSTNTNYVQAAYISRLAYATNYNVTFTNSSSVLVTNTYAGIYTSFVTNAASTNTLPLLYALPAPAASVMAKDVKLLVSHGLLVVPSTTNITLITTYRTP